ncbi:hypothetical protein L1049_004561 [Liquidambar formosana]|uniref:Uncharacterized protein n=1 Tax=Liquidambar formosana TaxID=63359 RepID=A0AAP0RP80_LIQFO
MAFPLNTSTLALAGGSCIGLHFGCGLWKHEAQYCQCLSSFGFGNGWCRKKKQGVKWIPMHLVSSSSEHLSEDLTDGVPTSTIGYMSRSAVNQSGLLVSTVWGNALHSTGQTFPNAKEF